MTKNSNNIETPEAASPDTPGPKFTWSPLGEVDPQDWDQADRQAAQEYREYRQNGPRQNLPEKILGFLTGRIIKPIQKMTFKKIGKWLRDRLKEPSSYKAVSLISGIIGVSISPDLWREVATLAGSVIGFIMFVEKTGSSQTDSRQEAKDPD